MVEEVDISVRSRPNYSHFQQEIKMSEIELINNGIT